MCIQRKLILVLFFYANIFFSCSPCGPWALPSWCPSHSRRHSLNPACPSVSNLGPWGTPPGPRSQCALSPASAREDIQLSDDVAYDKILNLLTKRCDLLEWRLTLTNYFIFVLEVPISLIFLFRDSLWNIWILMHPVFEEPYYCSRPYAAVAKEIINEVLTIMFTYILKYLASEWWNWYTYRVIGKCFCRRSLRGG